MTKKIKVITSVENAETLMLKMSGQVEKIARVTPRVVHLVGAPGEIIRSVVTIVPSEKYDFSIKDGPLNAGKNIDIELKQAKDKKKSWELVVTNTKKVVGRYYEVITLKTDSVFQPEMKIRVFGNIAVKGTRNSKAP